MARIMEAINVKYRVSFAPNTKHEYDTKEHYVLFRKCILAFFSNPRLNPFDLLFLIRTKKYPDIVLVNYFLRESTIIKDKLEKIKGYEDILKEVEDYYKKNNIPKRKVEEDPIWDAPIYTIRSKQKLQKGVAIIRKGSRIYSEKLLTVHIPRLELFIKLLNETLIILNIKETVKKSKSV
jgi:hypothetical protein